MSGRWASEPSQLVVGARPAGPLVFRHCAACPGGGEVGVQGSPASGPLQPRAHLATRPGSRLSLLLCTHLSEPPHLGNSLSPW